MNAEQILKEIILDLDAGISEKQADQAIKEFKERVDQPLDGKFSGYVWRNRDKKVEEAFVVFVPRDRLLVRVLQHYWELCRIAGCDHFQDGGVKRLIDRAEEWALYHKAEMKTPDAEKGECK